MKRDPVERELSAWKAKHGRDVGVRCFGTQLRDRWTDGPWWEAVSGEVSSGRCARRAEALEKLAELVGRGRLQTRLDTK